MKRLFVLLLLTLFTACGGGSGSKDFQQSEPTGFQLAEITEGYGAIDDAWNSIDTGDFNKRLKRVVDEARHDNFQISSYGFADILEDDDEPVAELVRTDLRSIISRLVDTQSRHLPKRGVESVYTGSGREYNQEFYNFLDRLSGQGFEAPPDYITGAANKIIKYILEECLPDDDAGNPDKAWLNEKVQDLADDLSEDHPVERDFKDDFIDLSELIAKITLQTDYPVWLDGSGNPLNYKEIVPSQNSNLDMGNAVKGSHDLVMWLNELIMNPDTRALLREAVLNFTSILNPSPEAELVQKLKALIVNLEDHFTIGGEVYEAAPIYSENSATTFSDSEMSQLIRDASPLMQQLFTRSDRPQSMIVTKQGEGPVYPLDLMNSNLRSIGFDPDTIDVERSIYDLMRYDLWGRDRLTDSNAFPNSHLESLLFLTQITANHGWQDGGTSGALPPQYIDSRVTHHQGAYTEELTLNDALFSIRMLRTVGTYSAYELAFNLDNGDHLYRSRFAFTLSQVDELHAGAVSGDDLDFRFSYDQNYGVLQFLAGPGPGDLGAPNGGNPNGHAIGRNQYRAYAPNGLNEKQMAAWTMGWGIRACFNGEGPYYYADPNAETVSVGGLPYRKYLRPNGKIYAFVSADGSRYIYPADEGDEEDPETSIAFNGARQRANRYKSQWYSDAYISHFTHVNRDGTRVEHFFTVNNDSGRTEIVEISGNPNAAAGRLLYKETIAEDNPKRACSSREEAFFRNYQWVMNEKKMVLIIPMYMNTGTSGGIKGAVFEVQECNGWSGLANLRRFRGNHVWAKQGTDGLSIIPGDYRFEVVSVPDAGQEGTLGAELIYNNNIDAGTATPAVVGHNLPALYRLAFPRSIDPQGTFQDKVLGSLEFEVGDDNWNNRNASVPILFSLLAGLRDHTPAYDPSNWPGINSGMRAFLNQTAIWIKPLFYYNHASQGASEQKAPFNTWVPRIYGVYDTNGDGTDDRPSFSDEYFYVHAGAPFLTSSADFYAEWNDLLLDYIGTPPNYFGSEAERRFYQPAVVKTFLNVMIDSDLADDRKRMDGLLPLITETRALSNLLKVLLHPSVQAPPLEQILTAIKFTKGEMTCINASPESGKGMDYPEWMFATGVEDSRDVFGAYTEYTGVREDDIYLDDLLDRIVGRDALDADTDGYGLADYPDEQERLAADPEAAEAPWEDFEDDVDTLADLLHESSPYCISTNLLDAFDRIFVRKEAYASEEIYGLLYAFGKLFGRYDPQTGRWVYQGEKQDLQDIYNMLATRVPVMNDVVIQSESQHPAALGGPPGHYGYGEHYYSQLVLMSKMNEPDALAEYIINTMSAPQDWATIMHDLNRFMHGYDIFNDNSELWGTLAQLLRDMGSAVGQSNENDVIDTIIEDYGFQVN